MIDDETLWANYQRELLFNRESLPDPKNFVRIGTVLAKDKI